MYDIFLALLKEKGVKVIDVCEATGIATSTMTDWKKGRSVPKVEKLKKIADYFGVSLDYLCTGDIKYKYVGSELSNEQLDYLKALESATPELRAAALAVLRSGSH